jgi:hypothetical protein
VPARLCCSYLRVYQPFAALSDEERSLVEVHRASRSADAEATVKRPVLALLAPEECSEVYEKQVDGETFFCPTHPRLRWLLGLASFERSTPNVALGLFFTRQEIAAARRELEVIERDHPGIRPPIVQAVWHVPPRWFVCFTDAERRFEQAGEHPAIRYETTVEKARERVGSALDTLTGGIVHPVIVGMIYELKEWLGSFDDRSVLELDYASVATLFDADDLADDHSSADVWSSIKAIGEGDGMKAGLYYRRVNERWTRSRTREALN